MGSILNRELKNILQHSFMYQMNFNAERKVVVYSFV